MKYFQILLLLGIFLTTILLSQSIKIPQKLTGKNETFNIPVFIDDAFEMTGVTIKITFNSNVIQFENLNINPLGIISNSFVSTGVYSVPDTIKFGLFSLSDLFTGSGMIAQISFQSVGQLGEYSILEFKDAQISGTNSDGMDSTWQIIKIDGSIEIVLDELSIIAVDESEIESQSEITLGMCETCSDGWVYGSEEQYALPATQYTNIYFYRK